MATRQNKKYPGDMGAAEWSVGRVVGELRRLGTKRNVEGMARFGIRAKKVSGASKPKLDALAKKIGKNHALGLKLWSTGIQDAKILAGMISEPDRVTRAQMELWVRDFAADAHRELEGEAVQARLRGTGKKSDGVAKG